jgi:hypothetical protein
MPDTVASWGGLEIQIVSQEVVDAVQAVKSFLELVNSALEIALAVGEVVKTFVTSNLNLARALANQLIAALRNLIRDLFSLGLYINLGDNDLVKRGVSNLRGGYPAYERRMLTRLNDRNDPNRPNFTESSTVLALFYYVGVDVSFTEDGLFDTRKFAPLMQFLRAFGSLFGFSVGGPNAGLPVATNLRVEYGSPTNTSTRDFSTALSSLMGRSTIEVQWGVAPAPGGSNQDPNPTIPPCGFLVEVSTYPTGFQVGWIAPTTSGTGGPNGTGSDGAQSYTTGQYQTADTGRPLVVFGGDDALHLTSDLQWPSGFTTGSTLPPGSHPAFFFRDASNPEVIRKAFGKSGTTYYNQRSFFVGSDSTLLQLISGGNYSLNLNIDDLPMYCPIVNGEMDTANAVRPTAVYVRVTPVTNNVTATNFNVTATKWTPLARTSDDSTLVHVGGDGVGTPGDADFGTPSSVLEVTIPSEDQDLYGRALQTAIAILVMSRSDLSPPDPATANEPVPSDSTYTAHGLESVATEVFQWMGISNPEEYFSTRGYSPQSFAQDLYPRIVAQADRFLASQGTLPPAVLTSLNDTMHALVEWKWSDSTVSGASGNSALRKTILESLGETEDVSLMVISRNRYGTRDYWSTTTPSNVLGPLSSKWRSGTFGIYYNSTSKDSSPVVGPSNGAQPGYWYARDLIPQEIYGHARRVLAITSDQSTQRTTQGSWKTVRVFSARAPTGTMLGVLTKVEGFLNTALSGMQSVADGILRVIAFLEQRVREIQELLKRIQTYLDIPFQISFPSAKVLLLVTNGTAGVVSGLTGATNKPTEGRSGYAGGGVIVAGSAPAILVELLASGLSSATNG